MKRVQVLSLSTLLLILAASNAHAGTSIEEYENQLEFLSRSQALPGQSPYGIAHTTNNSAGNNFTQGSSPVDAVEDGVGDTTGRVEDGIDGALGRGVGNVRGRYESILDRIMGGINSKIQDVLGSVFGPVNGQIDEVISDIGDYVDETLNSVLDPVEEQINKVLDSILGSAAEDVIGEVIGEGGGYLDDLLGGLLGRGGGVKPSFDPLENAGGEIAGNVFGESLPGITEPYSGTIPVKPGALGIGGFGNIRERVRDMARGSNGSPDDNLQGADRYSTNPEVLAASISNQVEREASRAMSESVLSEEGQEAMKAEQEGAEKTLKTIYELAEGAQEKDVTQDIMKDLIATNAQQSTIYVGQYRQAMEMRQQLASTGVSLVQISENLDGQRRALRSDLMGRASQMQDTASLFTLPGGNER